LYIVVTCFYAQLDAVAVKDTGPRVVLSYYFMLTHTQPVTSELRAFPHDK